MSSSLDRKQQTYLARIRDVQDKNGFIESSECDSLLFSGLVGCVPGVRVRLDAAFDLTSGQWHRRPLDKPCYPDHSKSTISRDMLLGVLWYAYWNKRLDISEQIVHYAIKHLGIMGQARDMKTLLGRCLMSPGLLSTAAWVSYRLGGPSRPWLRYLPHVESSKVLGFQAHLSVLHILLRNILTGKNAHKNTLQVHYKRNPENPLFSLAVGDYQNAEKILSNKYLWPEDRLPTNQVRKEAWIFQREYGKDWYPDLSTGVRTFSGGDFLFCYWLSNLLKNKE